ncbi:MAG: methyltransferase domain-containing protein [Solirubrobacterales bacterium]|nr:methyltransferase domain-containing protein [Solirubrobacterales bacterium]
MDLKLSAGLRRELVSAIRANGACRSDAVAAAFAAIPREAFLPELADTEGLEAVYTDDAIITKRNRGGEPLSSSSQPSMMAAMLELLAVNPGDNVLEVGLGTGYNAALLKHLTGPGGRVSSVDVDPTIVSRAARHLAELGVEVDTICGDGRHGHAANAPYQRIIVTAAAEGVTGAWTEQLAPEGRLVAPIRRARGRTDAQLIPAFELRDGVLRQVDQTRGFFMGLHD